MTLRHVQYDSIDTLSCLGYSEREATFLYTVAIYSGYFLRRQFNFSVKRHLGSAAAGFLAKAKRAGHVREIQCDAGRLLYQLYARWFYRIVGQENSQNRRAKSSPEIRRRLIMLDYILRHLGKEEFLDSEASQQKFFAQIGVKAEALASAKQFGERLPISARRAEGNLTFASHSSMRVKGPPPSSNVFYRHTTSSCVRFQVSRWCTLPPPRSTFIR
jgi:hypothetical protein